MIDVYGSLGSAQSSKCASSSILPKDYLSSSPPSYLGQAPDSSKPFPWGWVALGAVAVGAGALLLYSGEIGAGLGFSANPRAKRPKKAAPSTEIVPLDTLAPALLRLSPVEDITPLVKGSAVFVVDTDRAQHMTTRTVIQILGDPIVMDGSVSYMGLVNTAKEQPGRPIVITDGQRMSAGTIKAVGEIKSPVFVIGATSSETWGAPYDSVGRLNVLLDAAKASWGLVLVAVNGRWYQGQAKYVHDNPRKSNDEYSPFPTERLPGGRASGMRPSDFDPAELARGTEHELEHTDDWRLAQEIAQDHLVEDEKYYQKLDAMERGAFRGNPLEYDDSRDAWCDTGTGRCSPNAPFRDNPKLQWQGSGSGAWARGPNYKYYRLLQRAPGEWLVYFGDEGIGAERTPALAKRLAQQHAGTSGKGDYSVSFQTRRGSGQPGPWTTPDGDFATFEAAQDSARNTLARSTMFLNYRVDKKTRRSNPSCECR